MNKPKLRLEAPDGTPYEDWDDVPLGDLLEQYSKKTKTNNEDVLLSCAIDGMFLNSELFSHQRASDNTGYLKIDKGTLILSAQNLHLGNANVNMRFEHGIISPAYKTFHLKGCLPEFMAQWIKREGTKKFFYDATTTGASQCRRNVEWETLYEQPITLPSIEEQKAIADFLAIYDKKTANQKAKIEALERRKKGLLQQIFSQETRFKADDGSVFEDWEPFAMGDLFTERKTKAKGGEELLSVTIGNGVIKQSDSDKRDNSSEDKSNYKQVKKGDIAYNTMRMWQGAEGCSQWDGIVSPAYTVIVPNEGVDPEFFMILFKTWKALKLFTIYSQGLSSDNWNLKYEIFSELEFDIPCQDEQKKIVEFFKKIDKQIQVEKNKLDAIKNVKKGLLQQMLI